MDGELFERLTGYVKGIVTFHAATADLLIDAPLTCKLHIFWDFTIFLMSSFTRPVHRWCGKRRSASSYAVQDRRGDFSRSMHSFTSCNSA